VTTAGVIAFSVPELLGLLSVLALTAGFAVAMWLVISEQHPR
jgi:hypothetical protein